MKAVNRLLVLVSFAVAIGMLLIGAAYFWATQEQSFVASAPAYVAPVVEPPRWIKLEKERFADLTQEQLNIDRFHFPGNPKTQGAIALKKKPGPATADFYDAHRDFHKRLAAHFDTRVEAGSSQFTAERALIDEWVSLEGAPGQYLALAVVESLSRAAAAANAPDSTDALVRAINGAILLKQSLVTEAQKEFEGLPAKLQEQGYSAYFQAWVIAMHIESEKGYEKPASAKTVDSFTPVAIEWLRKASTEPKDFRYAWHVIAQGQSQMTIAQRADFFASVLSANDIDPWFVHLVAADFFRDNSWDARGAGFADTVNKQGWSDFGEFQQRASLHYQKAWLLRPEIPFACEEMIMISMAHKDEWSPRDWFDVTLQAQRDFDPAFKSYLHTLKPRWGGGLDEMFEFADECTRSSDFETSVPDYVMRVIEIAGREEFQEYPDRVLDHPGLQATLREFWTRYDQALQSGRSIPDFRIQNHMSWRAAIALKQHDENLLKGAILKLNGKLQIQPFKLLFAFPQTAMAQAFAVARCGEKAFQLGDQFGPDFDGQVTNQEIDAARKSVDELSMGATSDELHFFNSLRIVLQQMQDFHAGEWVEAKFNPEMHGWGVYGDVTVESETSVLISNLSRSSLFPGIAPLAAFPPPYEILATVEGIPGQMSFKTAGIEVGSLFEQPGGGDSIGRFFYANVNENIVGVVSASRQVDSAFHVDNIKRPVEFRIRISRRRYDVQTSGIALPLPPTSTFIASPRLLFGGARRIHERGSVRISNVRIHRLTVERPDDQTTDPKPWRDYYESIVEFDPQDSEVLLNLAQILADNEEFAEAKTRISRAAENGPISIERVDLLLLVDFGRNNLAEAKPNLEQAMVAFPGKPEYVEMMAWICATAADEESRDSARAKDLASQLLNADQRPSWKNRRAIAAAMAENGEFPEAIVHMEHALKLAPTDMHSELAAMLEILKSSQPIRISPKNVL